MTPEDDRLFIEPLRRCFRPACLNDYVSLDMQLPEVKNLEKDSSGMWIGIPDRLIIVNATRRNRGVCENARRPQAHPPDVSSCGFERIRAYSSRIPR
jgi:hypothetical protein